MRFVVLGPYPVPILSGVREVNFVRARDAVFDIATLDAEKRYGIDLKVAVGCYIFGLSPAGSPITKPYYVGQARKQSLYDRVFQKTDKPRTYNEIVDKYERASAFVYLLPLLTETGRTARIGAHARVIDNAEYALIGLARAANADLWNSKHSAGMDAFSIDGVFNSDGRIGQNAKDLRMTLSLGS